MKKNLSLLVLLLSTALFAQDFDLGKVSVEELSEKKHPSEPSAPAAILYKKGVTSFDFDDQGRWVIITDVTVRIKIYNKEGYKYANIEIPYYIGGANDEKVKIEEVYTYNIIKEKPERTKLTDESNFIEEVNSKWRIKKIAFPNVKEGSIVEYHYTITSPYITQFNDWYFQYKIPVNYIEYQAFIPSFFVYNRILSPFLPIDEKQITKKVTRRYVNTNGRGGYGQATSLGQNETGSVSFYEMRRTYTGKNIPSIRDEDYIDNINNYRSFVKHELASVQFPNSPEKKYATDWNVITKAMYQEEGYGKILDQNNYFAEDLEPVLKGKTQQKDIINEVFNYLKQRMVWNGEYGYKPKLSLKTAYEEKTGNAAEINLMLIAMLRYAGVNTNPILLSTRDNGHVSFVNKEEFNYIIAGVEFQNQVICLDATSKNAMPDILPIRDLNISGRIIRENNTSKDISLIPQNKSKENTLMIAEVKSDGTIVGKVKSQYFDYNAMLFREKNNNGSQDAKLQYLGKDRSLEISEYKTENTFDFEKPVIEDFSFKTYCDVIGDKIYFSPLLMYSLKKDPFVAENRVYPIDFGYPKQERCVITVSIPEGYVVESLPETVQFTTMDNVITYRLHIDLNANNQIQIVSVKDVNYARLNAEYYPSVKGVFTNILKKHSEKIVLVKK